MAFDKQESITPVSIGDLSVQLTDYVTGDKSAGFELQVVMSDGTIKLIRGDLIPHITIAQRDALIAFMEALRTQAETQVLP